MLLFADDLGYNELGYTGGGPFLTPNIDDLALNGIRFTNGYVTSPVCSPSRAGLLTGVYQQRFGFEMNPNPPGSGFQLGQTTLLDHLAGLGYTTGVIGKWHVGTATGINTPLDAGAAEFFGITGGQRSYWGGETGLTRIMRRNNVSVEAEWINEGDPALYDPVDGRYVTDAFGEEAAAFIDAHHADPNPFFLYLAFTAAHVPLGAKQADLDLFPELSGEQRVRAAMTVAMDRAVGMVLEALSDHELDDDTIIVFLNDNGGTGFGEGEPRDNGTFRDYKNSPYEGGIRVPFLMSVPGLPGDVDFDAPVIAVDIAPTLIAAAGGTMNQTDGVNLLPHLAGAMPADPHDVLFWRHAQNPADSECPEREEWAVRKGDWKLIRPTGCSPLELYDLATDPGETTDLAESNPLVVEDLLHELTLWEAELDKPRWGDDSYNQFDHFTYAGASPVTCWSETDAWTEGETTNAATLVTADAYADAILEFETGSAGYEACNDMVRMTGQTFMLNQLRLGGQDASSGATGNITGNPLLLVRNRVGDLPEIRLDSAAPDAFTFTVANDLLLLDDVLVTGGGSDTYVLAGDLSEYVAGRSMTKTGAASMTLTGHTALSGTLRIDGGQVQITGGGSVSVSELRVGAQSVVNTTTLCSTGSCGAALECGAITIEVRPDGWGVIHATEAVLGGTLEVNATGPTFPAPGTTIDLITAPSLNGQFDLVNAPCNFEVSYLFTRVQLTVNAPSLPGDANCDGLVNIEDLLDAIGSWGPCPDPCPPSCPSDHDGDCAVGVNDLLIVLGNWSP